MYMYIQSEIILNLQTRPITFSTYTPNDIASNYIPTDITLGLHSVACKFIPNLHTTQYIFPR